MWTQVNLTILWTAYLTVQSQSGLNTNEETFDSESLEHNFGNLLSVFWRIKWWLSQNESVLLWLASKI